MDRQIMQRQLIATTALQLLDKLVQVDRRNNDSVIGKLLSIQRDQIVVTSSSGGETPVFYSDIILIKAAPTPDTHAEINSLEAPKASNKP